MTARGAPLPPSVPRTCDRPRPRGGPGLLLCCCLHCAYVRSRVVQRHFAQSDHLGAVLFRAVAENA